LRSDPNSASDAEIFRTEGNEDNEEHHHKVFVAFVFFCSQSAWLSCV
jgi:hypothetical protein